MKHYTASLTQPAVTRNHPRPDNGNGTNYREGGGGVTIYRDQWLNYRFPAQIFVSIFWNGKLWLASEGTQGKEKNTKIKFI